MRKINSSLRWSFSVGNKIFRVVPLATLLVVVATLVSQFSIVLASLLPLKVIMLLGSTGVPRYFPSFFSNVDRDFLVVSLSVLAIFFFILYMLADKVISYGAGKGAALLLERSQKMTLFENQEEIASRAYQRYSRTLSSAILVSLVSAVMCWLYLDLVFVLFGYSLVAFLFLAIFYSKGGRAKISLDDEPGKVVNTITGVGFLLSFLFMVAQFLWGSPPGLMIAVVSLILMRQGFSRIVGMVNDLKWLYDQRLKINALFFHGHVFINEAKKHETNFWVMLQPDKRDQWVRGVFENICEQSIEEIQCEWLQLDVQDVIAFRVRIVDGKGSVLPEYLLKLFNSNKSAVAKHEATLLTGGRGLPALPLIRVVEVQGLHCHVMQWHPCENIPKNTFDHVKNDFLCHLMEIQLDRDLVSRFSRSRPPLWQRVDSRMVEKLRAVAEMMGREHAELVERFISLRGVVSNCLENLPLTIVCPDVSPNTLLQDKDGRVLLMHWARWSMEPVGAGWPIQPKQLRYLGEVVLESANPQLQNVSPEHACLSALMFTLERQLSRQQFAQALKLIPEILACVEDVPEKTPLAESKV